MSRIKNPTITHALGFELLDYDFCDGQHFDLSRIISDESLPVLRRRNILRIASEMFSLFFSDDEMRTDNLGFLALAKKMAAPSWGKKPTKTERVKVIQQCYGGVWEDVCVYAYTHSAKEVFADIKAYRESGYPTRLVTRREKIEIVSLNVYPDRVVFGWHNKADEAFVHFRANWPSEDLAIAAFFKHYGLPFTLVPGADMPIFQWDEDTNRHYLFDKYVTTSFAETLSNRRTEFVRVKK